MSIPLRHHRHHQGGENYLVYLPSHFSARNTSETWKRTSGEAGRKAVSSSSLDWGPVLHYLPKTSSYAPASWRARPPSAALKPKLQRSGHPIRSPSSVPDRGPPPWSAGGPRTRPPSLAILLTFLSWWRGNRPFKVLDSQAPRLGLWCIPDLPHTLPPFTIHTFTEFAHLIDDLWD